INFNKIYPHLIAILIFIILSAIYFSPIVMEGKQMRQMDVTHSSLAAKELKDYAQRTGKDALWTNSMFSGMPAYQIKGAPYFNVFSKIASVFRLGLPLTTIGIIFVCMLGFYILLLTLGFDIWLSIIGAIAFAFSSYNFIIIEAGHVNKAYAIAYMAPVLAGIILTYRGKYLLGGVLTLIMVGIESYYNHPQMSYYLFMIIAVLVIVKFIFAIKEKTLKNYIIASLILVLATAFSIAPSAATLLPTFEYSKYTIRGKNELSTPKEQKKSSGLDIDYALAWSYGKAETFTLLIPNFNGGSSTGELSENSEMYKALENNGVPNAKMAIKQMPTYWGDMPFTSGAVYFGAIVCFLFILGLFVVKGSEKWWLLIATILSITLAWGKNLEWFTDIFFYNVPMYNKFRAVSSMLVSAGLTVPALAMLAVKNIMDNKTDQKKLTKYILYSLGIVGGISLIFALVPDMFFNFVSPEDAKLRAEKYPEWFFNALYADRASLLKSDAFRSFIFILLSAGLLWAYVNKKLKKNLLISGLGVLILIDLWAVDKRYVNEDSFESASLNKEEIIQPTAANLQILKDNDPDFRVYNLTSNPFTEVNTSYFHKSIGGYHGAKLRRYQDLIDRYISKNNMNVMNMLNTKYFIVPSQNQQDPNPIAQLNPGALGNAWFVNNYKIVNNPDEELGALKDFNPAKTAIVDKSFSSFVSNIKNTETDTTNNGSVKLLEYEPDKLIYESRSDKEKLAVFSEIYYPKGWNSFIDGKPVSHFRVNYVLRAMVVPAGDHKIEFRFEPQVFYTGKKISTVSSIVVILLIISALFFEIKNIKPTEIEEKIEKQSTENKTAKKIKK
ncbi:MAG: YfhO family protein, partial [Bacteroidota bacterium]|nr:YfhO family protein [Bacteroidota bacterium]